MKTITKYLCGFFVSLFLGSCSYDFPGEEQQTVADFGEINPENFIVVGDDYLAGLMDGALYTEGQKNSVAAILSSQLHKIQANPFTQAEIVSENGFNIYASTPNTIYGKWIYKFENQLDENPERILLPGEQIQSYLGEKDLLNDISVPGLTVKEIQNAKFNENPFLSRVFFSDQPNLIDQIVEKSPTLVCCWLGMNDFLKFAVNGAKEKETLTQANIFEDNLKKLMDRLLNETEAKIVLGNLISFKDLPYFYSRTYNSIFLENSELGQAQTNYSDFNNAVTEYNRTVSEENRRPYIDFYDNGGSSLHPQNMVVVDELLPDASYPDGKPLEKLRQLNENELVFSSITDEMVENGTGWLIPVTENEYLTEQQIQFTEEQITAFNSVIYEIANNSLGRITLVDLNVEIKRIADTGKTDAWGEPIQDEAYDFNGVPIEGSMNVNGIFSLDGLHFNQRGNAFVCNLFIEAINHKFSANIKSSDINSYVGNPYTD